MTELRPIRRNRLFRQYSHCLFFRLIVAVSPLYKIPYIIAHDVYSVKYYSINCYSHMKQVMDTAAYERKSIPKGVRFDVFKRDSFKCQYCGATAPDILLEIDHIKPVSKGGTNDITNLITSCQACNTGKSDKLLDQNSAVAKSRTQLEQLQERREQLEMMMAWMEGLRELKDAAIDRVSNYWHELAPGYTVN